VCHPRNADDSSRTVLPYAHVTLSGDLVDLTGDQGRPYAIKCVIPEPGKMCHPRKQLAGIYRL
jgi:hypothetical protein